VLRVAIAALALAAAGCEERSAACSSMSECESCTSGGGCAWCFETGECLIESTICPGDVARTPDQCELEEPRLDGDAGVDAPPR